MVAGHWAHGVGFTSKEYKTDVIVGSTSHKARSHLLGSLQSVRTEILEMHRIGHVKRKDDIDALRIGLAPTVGTLWTCQGDNGHGSCTTEQREIDMTKITCSEACASDCFQMYHAMAGISNINRNKYPGLANCILLWIIIQPL